MSMIERDLEGSLYSESEENLGSMLIVIVKIKAAFNCMDESMLALILKIVCVLVKVCLFPPPQSCYQIFAVS